MGGAFGGGKTWGYWKLTIHQVLWTDHYSKQFLIFVALAILESHRDSILRYLVEFDEILKVWTLPGLRTRANFSSKYCNQLSMTIELESTLAQAEVLFLSFRQIIQDIDARQAELLNPSGLRHRAVGEASSSEDGESRSDGVVTGLKKLPHISDNLRELLKANH